MDQIETLQNKIRDLENLLEVSERKSDILTNLLKEATAEFHLALDKVTISEANFRAIFENAPEAIYILDADTQQILDCNPFTCEWLGYTHPELFTMRVGDILETPSATIRKNIQTAITSGRVHIQERQFRKKNGTIADAEVTGAVVEYEGKKCFVSLVRDITERKRINELTRYKELFDNVSDPVFINDANGRFLEVNDVACDRFGYKRAELIHKSIKDIADPIQRKLIADMGRKIQRGETVQFELRMHTQSGEQTPFEFHARRITYKNKPAVLSVARDLSVRQKMEKVLIRTERLSAVGEMASGVAHNFNNLLQVIMGAGEAALTKLSTGEIRKCREAIVSLIDASQRGADIVKRIKDFTSDKTDDANQGKVFDVGELLADAVQLTKPLWANPAAAHKYRLNYIRPLWGFVRGNPSELYEVLVNLIKNALEAMPDGGIVTITTENRNECVYLSVADTGDGVSEKHLRRIFQPFFTTKGSQSSGLGLSSSYGIIKRHQGELIVRNRRRRGAVFTIRLPQAGMPPSETSQKQNDNGDSTDARVKFLMIDDEINILKMMTMFFEDTDVVISTASTAEKGLRAIRNDRFDVILCDLGMDHMNGLEVSAAATAHAHKQGNPKTPFLLYTGLDQQLAPDELKRCGVDHVVKKPVACEDLLRIIQNLIRKP